MKTAVLVLIFTIVVVTEGNRCRHSFDCDQGECCIQGVEFGLFLKGKCIPLAKEEKPCSDHDAEFSGKYIEHCPCETGLKCKPESVKDLGLFGKIKYNERCVSGDGETTSEPETESEPEPETEPEHEPEPEE